ncbi:MAG: AAA family ATPase, partial [Ilumatobacteraceae bacterium]
MTAALDVFDLLQPLREAGVLGASDVHIAAALARLGGCDDETVALAAALAARAPRVGHTCVDLGALGSVDPPIALPELDAWTAAISASPLTRGPDAPLVLDGNRLYLHRYWAYEQAVSAHLATRAVAPAVAVEPSPDVLDALLTGEGAAAQCDAVVMALHQSLTVLVGGPGTGKTTTVAALLACLTAHDPSTRIALAA